MMARSFSGIYPMVYAFFDEEGSLACEPVLALVEAMVRHRVHGVAVLGLASEVNKLSLEERHQLLDWVAEAVAGRVPLCVTVAESSVREQVAFGRTAIERGAQWLILQPPPVKGIDEGELIRFFGAVADKIDVPVAIQNAPQYLGIGLSNRGLKELNSLHPNVAIVKTEATAVAVERLISETDGRLAVFNGRGGLEMVDALRAGCAGLIPGGESFDRLVRAYEEMRIGHESEAEVAYGEALPVIAFLEDTVDHLVAYGKLVAAHRLGMALKGHRLPTTETTAFGIAAVERFARQLGPL
jgi:2-keto-3-deoxy-L-arabinonate dehydratase